MKSLPVIPSNAPFTTEQRAWLNGFLAGVFATESGAEPVPAATQPAEPLLVMFGSQTGGAEGLAKRFAREASAKGFAPRVLPLNEFEKAELAKATKLVVISSTWGDGEPPDNAVNFWSWLSSETAPRFENLHFAVLGLGDKNYADFCGASKKFDARLESLGARRLLPRAECDVDYEAVAQAWMENLWPALGNGAVAGKQLPAVAGDALAPSATDHEPSKADTPAWTRANPFPAHLKTNRQLNQPGSAKDTRHFEIVLEGSGLSYEVGDALGVMPQNCPVLVEELLAALGFKGEEIVKDANDTGRPLHEALLNTFVITQPTPSFVKDAATRGGNAELLALLDPARKTDFDKWVWGRDVVDVLKVCGRARFTPAEFTAHLRKLQPRLYSISSSPKAHPGEVHLTIAAVRYENHGREKKGVASCWLADRVVLNQSAVPVFVQTSHGFRLPAEGDRPIIMIGPGTGIAPFRAFLEERRAIGAKGPNWLFFGDQQRSLDFLYQDELTAMQADGTLTRLDLAFSRDQKEKIYVQDRMLEAAGELWSWLEAGAHLYVCGDAKRMAKDVDAALHEIIELAGGRTKEQATEYVAKMKTEKRYQRDVY